MSTESSVRFTVKNELTADKINGPPIANHEDFDEEEEEEFDEIDGEFTPLNRGIDDGFLVPRNHRRKSADEPNKKDKRTDQDLVPAGYFPQPNHYPDYGPDGNFPSLNLYQQKKSMAQGMLDLALLSANANQLRYVLDSDTRNHYFYVSLSLISTSLVLQVLVAIALVFKSRYNIDKAEDYANADRINNFILIGILLITISNVVSSAFAPAPINKS